MRPATLPIVIMLLIIFFGTPAVGAGTLVTLHLPEAVLTNIITDAMPLPIDPQNESIHGAITIQRISNLHLKDRSVTATIGLSATDLQVNTNVAGHQIRLNVGSVQTDFGLTATLRFNPTDRTLFFRPEVRPLGAPGQSSSNDIAVLLAGVFNGREIPITIDRLQPLVTNTGSKELTVELQLTDIAVVPEALVLSFHPAVSTSVAATP
ncbi:hypothetical protein [Desulfofustis limnaeus]|uniref:DUF4403 family protein n=1 Tax=Desulfofustis limnaeus TaxID=2740163 RepID=A0ABM7W4K5_9BACT|nr:hypothetical protein [Desulfofustis limnaeus]MDX9895995.1 hypothetical protein [Desulfofustis sp.]BDD85833.1 hypothetical protein DPPLL_01980 [Desulfofustis limnaeus]